MAITRPIVLVFQEFATLTVTPSTPDLNCLVVGPCFWIEDDPDDIADIDEGAFVKSPYADADAPCDTDGSSLGRPDAGSDYLVISEPPNNATGAVLDSSSVEIVLSGAYIELEAQADGVVTGTDDNEFTSAAADFVTYDVAAGDRVVFTKNGESTAAFTIVKTIKEVTDLNTLKMTSTFKAADVAKIGSSTIYFRVEHAITYQAATSDYYTVVGQETTVKTGPTGLLLTYNSNTYPTNFALNIYMGYRSLRQDLSSDISTIDDTTALTATLGAVDERNPLAVGVSVALSNTGTPVQALAVETDDLLGHQGARDTVSTRDDVYAIVPVSDDEDGLATANWVAVISMWKAHCIAFADSSKSKYRIVIGSYDELPTEKASAPASDEGYTYDDSEDATWNLQIDAQDDTVFVDPASLTDFETAGVDSTHLIDTFQSTLFADLTAPNGHSIFSDGYLGAKALRGAMGGKRLRVEDADKFASSYGAESVSYAVRAPILKSEDVPAVNIIADTSSADWHGATPGRIDATGAFGNVAVGDVVHIPSGGSSTHDGGWVVNSISGAPDYIVVNNGDTGAEANMTLQIYRPVASSFGCTLTIGPINILKGTGDFASAAAGDIVCVVSQVGAGTSTLGQWILTNKTDSDNITVADPDSNFTVSVGADTEVVIFRPVAFNGTATATTRNRMHYLRDDSASFLTTVEIAENIEIPYPADTDPTKWDTTTTTWPVEAIMDDNRLIGDLEELEELAPDAFIAGFAGDMDYRISIDLDRAAQVVELNTIPSGLASSRCVMAWPNECMVSGLTTQGGATSSWQKGWYLACTIGGMIAGLPSHQGFTFIGIGGVSQIRNSNTYFTDDQIDTLSEGGWYVFLQDSESSSPYSAHEVTTDTATYEMGELMNVKNFDYIAMYYKAIMEEFLGRYNITNETLQQIRDSFNNGTDFLQLRTFPRIGAPLIDAEITSIEQLAGEVDRVEIFATVDLPTVLNTIGLHLRA